MKKWLWLMLCGFLTCSAHGAELYKLGAPGTAKLGAFLAMPSGGDLEQENNTVGADLIFQITKYFSVELSLFELSDEFDIAASDTGIEATGDEELKTLSFALSARGELEIASRFGLYGGGGIGYYHFNPDQNVTVEAVDPFGDMGEATDSELNVDSTWGYHALGGARLLLWYNLELFADYRYTWLDPNLEFNATVHSADGDLLAEISQASSSYNYGLIRIGLNCYF